MNKTFLAKMKKTLLVQKQEILKQVKRQEVDVDTEGDETDEIQGNMLIELTNQMNTRQSSKLAQIETALKRIEDKSYGKCEDCDEQIPDKRLLINPHFQT